MEAAFILFVLSIYSVNAQLDCTKAPNPGIRWICNQITNWDNNSRNRPLVAPAPSVSGQAVGAGAATPTNTYQCQNISCICQISGGSGGETCTFANGQVYRKIQRKEIRSMSDAELSRYSAAMWAIKRNGEYNSLTAIHSNVQVSPGAHSGPAFTPWHREFLKRLEISLRRVDPSVSLPYWDSTLDYRLPNPTDSVLWHPDLMGYESTDGQVRNGLFANWPYADNSRIFRRSRGASGALFTPTDLSGIYAQTDVNQVLANTAPRSGCPNPAAWTVLEYEHGNPHLWVGGDMANIPTSTNDPIFYSHHAFIDYIWENWRLSRQTRAARATGYPQDNINCHSQVHNAMSSMQPFTPFVNSDGLSNMYTDSLYSYAASPTCSSANTGGCNSKFLFCDLSHSPVGCSSKIVIGGNCQGYYYNEDRCYQGTCVNGVCVSSGTTTSPTTTPSPSNTCFNENVCCDTWASSGQCTQSAAYMRSNCMASCRICTPPYNANTECSDRSPSCPAWAQRGECTNTYDWMRENCRVSCNYCGTTRAQDCRSGATTVQTPTTTTSTPAPTTATPSTCLNNHYCCPVYAQTYCSNPSYTSYMSQNCAASCRLCTPPPNFNQCADYSPNCRTWASQGYCATSTAYMYENCKVSCNACSLLNANTLRSACGGSTTTSSDAVRPNPRPGPRIPIFPLFPFPLFPRPGPRTLIAAQPQSPAIPPLDAEFDFSVPPSLHRSKNGSRADITHRFNKGISKVSFRSEKTGAKKKGTGSI